MSRYEKTSKPGIFRDRRSGILYLRETVHDPDRVPHFVDRSLKTDKFELAKVRADKIRKKIMTGEKDVAPGETPAFDTAFDLVLKMQSTKGKKTHTMAKTQIKHLRPWFSEHCPLLKTFETNFEEKWADYKLAQAELTPGRKLEHDRRHLLMALKRAKAKGWIKRDFQKKMFDLKEASEPVGEYIETDEVKAILRFLQPHEKMYLQVLMAVTMGMRKSEIMALRVEEVDLKNREIHLDPHRIKTRKPRKVPIPIAEDVYPLLKKHVDEAKGPYVFPKWYTNIDGQPVDWNQPMEDNRYYWRQARDAAKVEVRFHDLRHTAITNLLKGGVPVSSVAKVVGATEDVVSRIYDKLTKDTKGQIAKLFCGIFVENSRT